MWQRFQLGTLLRGAYRHLLDFLFPKNAVERWLATAAPEDFISCSKPTREPARGEALFSFGDPLIRKSIHALKYRGNADAARLFGALLAEELLADAAEGALFARAQRALLVPVPLSAARRRERGYNQAELVTAAVAQVDGETTLYHRPAALARIKHTPSQTKMASKVDRAKNLAGAFRADPNIVAGKTVILVDDVVTTGATLAGASKALRAAGAKRVRCYALAH